MKALHMLAGSEKARLLHDLFPDEIPALLENIGQFCSNCQENKEKFRNNWNSGFMTFDYWLCLLEETARILNQHKSKMVKAAGSFPNSFIIPIPPCL